jgi:hypothetical protein
MFEYTTRARQMVGVSTDIEAQLVEERDMQLEDHLATMQAQLDALSAVPSARGVVALATTNDTDQAFTTITNVTGLSAAFTAVTGRRYVTTAIFSVVKTSAAGDLTASITDAANNTINVRIMSMTLNEQKVMVLSWSETGLSGSVTRKVRIAGTGSVVNSFGRPGQIRVEDVGPV